MSQGFVPSGSPGASGAKAPRPDDARGAPGHGSAEDWNQHWEGYAESNAFNPSQAYRRRLIFERLALGGPGVRLLDVGSGSGAFAAEVDGAYPGVQIVGLDGSLRGVEMARRRVPRARFFEANLAKPIVLGPAYQKWATHAVCSEVLEHVDDPVLALRNVRPLLAPGCRFVVTVPAGPMSAFDKHIGHRGHFRPDTLRNALESAGLVVEDVRGAGFPFFNLYRLAVVARGEALIEDAAGPSERALPLAARASMRAFSWLFKLNTSRSMLGWQLVALAKEPSA
jgi:SAM-dependent methyltransferase